MSPGEFISPGPILIAGPIMGITKDKISDGVVIDGPSMIFTETIRQVTTFDPNPDIGANQATKPVAVLNERMALHESIHQFAIIHDDVAGLDDGPLKVAKNLFGTDAENRLTPQQQDWIRRMKSPKRQPPQ